MARERQLAIDAPVRSAAVDPGRHLLGRVYTPDPRDWSLQRLMAVAAPSDAILGQTIQQVMDSTQYLSSWPAYLALWRWLKTKQHPVAPVPPAAGTPAWELLVQLDQGQTGHCVGFGWAGWGDAAPVEDTYQNADGNAIYYECKVIDGQPHQENGSSVRSGALAMRARGRLSAFAFATSSG